MNDCNRRQIVNSSGSHEAAEARTDIARQVGKHLIEHLALLKGDFGGFPIDPYDHSLQAATRAFIDGRDAEYVVCALFHDIGDTLAPYNHAEMVAEVMRPYITEKNHFMLQRHGVFQGYDFWGKINPDVAARAKYACSPYFDHTAEFCEKYDAPSFDAGYSNLPIESFMPLIQKVLQNPWQGNPSIQV